MWCKRPLPDILKRLPLRVDSPDFGSNSGLAHDKAASCGHKFTYLVWHLLPLCPIQNENTIPPCTICPYRYTCIYNGTQYPIWQLICAPHFLLSLINSLPGYLDFLQWIAVSGALSVAILHMCLFANSAPSIPPSRPEPACRGGQAKRLNKLINSIWLGYLAQTLYGQNHSLISIWSFPFCVLDILYDSAPSLPSDL